MTNQTRASQLHSVLQRLMDALARGTEADAMLRDLPVLQLRCLQVIGEQANQRMGDVARRVAASLPTTSRAVNQLARRGLVHRSSDTQDRRAVLLTITDTTRRLLARDMTEQQGRLAVCLQHFESEEAAHAVDVLKRLAAAVEILPSNPERK